VTNGKSEVTSRVSAPNAVWCCIGVCPCSKEQRGCKVAAVGAAAVVAAAGAGAVVAVAVALVVLVAVVAVVVLAGIVVGSVAAAVVVADVVVAGDEMGRCDNDSDDDDGGVHSTMAGRDVPAVEAVMANGEKAVADAAVVVVVAAAVVVAIVGMVTTGVETTATGAGAVAVVAVCADFAAAAAADEAAYQMMKMLWVKSKHDASVAVQGGPDWSRVPLWLALPWEL